MKRKIKVLMLFCVILGVVLCLGACSSSTTGPTGATGYMLQFQNGVYPSANYAGSAVTGLNEASQNTNYSAYNAYWIGYYGYKSRAVVRYDLTSIVPSNIKVTKAYLTLTVLNYDASNTYTAYALTTPFVGTTATWLNKDTGTPWTAAGGDYSAIAKSNAVCIGSMGTYVFKLDAAMVQSWIASPTTNYGIILVASNETTGINDTDIAFNANATAASRPMLTIYYTLP
jgi:hypothetical protein